MPTAAPVHRYTVGSGDAQTRATLEIMADVARRAALDARIVDRAVGVVRHVSGRAPALMARTIDAWLRAAVQFLPDPLPAGDWVRTPAALLRELDAHGVARGDCDDAAVLAAALGMAVGLPARFRAVALTPGGPFEHVWTELLTPEGWVVLDPTRGPAPLGTVDRSMLLEV